MYTFLLLSLHQIPMAIDPSNHPLHQTPCLHLYYSLRLQVGLLLHLPNHLPPQYRLLFENPTHKTVELFLYIDYLYFYISHFLKLDDLLHSVYCKDIVLDFLIKLSRPIYGRRRLCRQNYGYSHSPASQYR